MDTHVCEKCKKPYRLLVYRRRPKPHYLCSVCTGETVR